MILVATTLSNTVTLPGLSFSVNTAVFWLILAGLTTLTLTEDPLKVGHGLFTALTGFELYYATVEKSPVAHGALGGGQFVNCPGSWIFDCGPGRRGLEEER